MHQRRDHPSGSPHAGNIAVHLRRVAKQQAEPTTAVVVPRGVHEDLDAERVATFAASLQVVSQRVPQTVGELVLPHQLPVDPDRCRLRERDFRCLPGRDGKDPSVGWQVRDDVDVTPLEGPIAPLLEREQSGRILLRAGRSRRRLAPRSPPGRTRRSGRRPVRRPRRRAVGRNTFSPSPHCPMNGVRRRAAGWRPVRSEAPTSLAAGRSAR